MHIDFWVALGGLVVGLVVGLTGMGGGALMTPMLILLFGVQPLAAVSSDLVAAVVMKPVGGAVHLSRGTVHLGVVRWLALGSVPSAFVGVLLLRWIGSGDLQRDLTLAMGAALLLALAGMAVRALLGTRQGPVADDDVVPPVRPLVTVGVGVLGGLIVGMTSVGSGSLMIVLLMLLYPQLPIRRLVGTDLVQAIPLVASAALGQLIFGDVKLGLTTSLLIGSLPGVYVGARFSAAATGSWVRWVLGIVIAASAAKLLGADNVALGVVVVAGAAVWLGSTVVVPRARRAVPSGA
ncbi:MAG TPA: sulfite exporter TauE/SafE family protein [Mycobacteriales bacterium]